jgi:hypothetical protein
MPDVSARQIVASITSILRGMGAQGKHGLSIFYCPVCQKAFREKLEVAIHITRRH